MITPTVQSGPSALNRDNPGKSDDPVCFHGRSISQLPPEVLPGITQYLSMREVLVLGQVCRDLRSKLEECGVITNIWNYLSLPTNKKRTVHRLVTGNRLLIDYLRNNPAGYRNSFPIQHGPAIFVKKASHFREQTVSTSSISLVPSGCINLLSYDLFCEFNDQHNCLIQEDNNLHQLHIWTNQKDGTWEREHTISYEMIHQDSRQHGADIIITSGREDGKPHLLIVKRNELGEWHETQKQCLHDISSSLENYFIYNIYLAKNHRLMLCNVAKINDGDCGVLIFGRDADGRWLTKGVFQFHSIITNLKFKCSQCCRHVAVFTDELIFCVSEQDDGTWIKTGRITTDLYFEERNLKFSMDDHHFVALGEVTIWQISIRTIIKCSHVIVASCDEQGHWSEVKRIIRTCDLTILQTGPYARFSSDSKHLFICIADELIILSLHERKWVSSTSPFKLTDSSSCKISTTMDPSLFMINSKKTACIYAIDASGVWRKQHEFLCFPDSPPKISPDGNTVICPCGENRHIDIWVRRHPGQWIKQQPAISACWVEFSPDGSLVALAGRYELILLGLTEDKQWQKKGHQLFKGRVEDLCFSPCGRSIRVDYAMGESVFVTLWQIEPQEPQSGCQSSFYTPV